MGVGSGSARLLAAVLDVLTVQAGAGAHAQAPVLTAADYAPAGRRVGCNVNPLVDHAVTAVRWLDAAHVGNRDHDVVGDRFLQMRRRWDSLLRYRMGATPPAQYPMHHPQD